MVDFLNFLKNLFQRVWIYNYVFNNCIKFHVYAVRIKRVTGF